VGLRAASGDLLALLNNDTEAHPEWLAALVSAMESHPNVGFCASKMLFADRRDYVNSAGLFLRVDGVGRDIGYGRPDGPEFACMVNIFGASGGAALYRRAMLDDVGLLDEDLMAYAEDLDLSFRAQLRGWPCLYVPAAIVYHRMGATFGRESPAKVYHSSCNMLTVLLKNMPANLLRRHWPQMLAAQIYQVLYYSLHGRAQAVIRGKIAAVRKLRGTLAKRRVIQQSRRVPDQHIEAMLSAWRCSPLDALSRKWKRAQ
jgi:GT2 family glycosyltransferase